MDAEETYWQFVESERHFNTIQAGIRNRASTWILLGICFFQAIISIWVQIRKSKVNNQNMAENFDDGEFTKLFSKDSNTQSKFKKVIARHESKRSMNPGPNHGSSKRKIG